MSLSGEQDDVAGLRGTDRALDGGATVFFDDEWRVRLANAGDDLFDDGGGPLAARVVAGHDDQVAGFSGGKAHLRTLGAVAVAAAAEERDDAAVDGCRCFRGRGRSDFAVRHPYARSQRQR